MASSSASRKRTKKVVAKPVEHHDSDDNNESGFQKVERFVKLSGNIYPDLVKVFLTNMWIDDGVIYSQVKGVGMAITDKVWLSVAGVRDAEIIMCRANVVDLGGFDKV